MLVVACCCTVCLPNLQQCPLAPGEPQNLSDALTSPLVRLVSTPHLKALAPSRCFVSVSELPALQPVTVSTSGSQCNASTVSHRLAECQVG